LRKFTLGAVAVAGAAALAATSLPAAVASPPSSRGSAPAVTAPRSDNLPDAKADKRNAIRSTAIENLVNGKATATVKGTSKVVAVGKRADGKTQYAQVASAAPVKTDSIFTILTDFGSKTDPRASATPGPAHNEIAQPDRAEDNSTNWTADFSRQHYLDMFFKTGQESFADFYSKQSGGKYAVTGDVTNWVTVPYNEARYGSNSIPESDGYWNYIGDTVTAWYNARKAAGKTDAELKAYLAQFDKWDRYDYDGDGNFDEPDGYIDHFQAVHAGEGEEAGGGAQGTDAIWSHRWAAYPNSPTGPSFNKSGGTAIGTTGFFVRDYTTEPENGGLGVFSHEYGHDLGLPDLYDTAGGENTTGFWTLMSSGSWMNHGKDSIGTTPGYMGAWEKLQLGWLDYDVAAYDQKGTYTLGPAETRTKNAQALVVALEPVVTTTDYTTPFAGSYSWWGGAGDNLNSRLTRPIDLTGKTTAGITAKVWYDTEEDYDYLYGQVSDDGGASWADAGAPINGTSEGEWVDASYDLTPWAGQKILFRFAYVSDSNTHGGGPFLDQIVGSADGATIFTDGAESANSGWTVTGFTRSTGSSTESFGRYYIAENRQYIGYDKTLKTGPYNFSRGVSKPNWVQHIPYQNGVLLTYWDASQADNNTSQHPGSGLILPIDARPKALTYTNGQLVSNRLQPFDATFGVEKTDGIVLSREVKTANGVNLITASVKPSKAVTTFDDTATTTYFDPANPMGNVITAGSGVRIKVLKQSANAQVQTLQVLPPKVGFNKFKH
jgi:immune inhibitor A